MLVPLYVLAAGSLLAGWYFKDYFFANADLKALFWSTSIYRSPENEIVHHIHEAPLWVKLAPTAMMALGLAIAFLFYIVRPAWPARLAAMSGPIYRFLLNKWYFDELYDVLFVRPAKALGRFLWKKGDGWLIDGLGPDGVSARVLDVTRGVVRLQTGLRLPLRVCHADRRGAARHLVHVRRPSLMPGWPILSLVTFLPLIGALFVLVIRGDDAIARRNMRWTALFTTLLSFALSLSIWLDFDRSLPGFQFLEERAWLGDFSSYRMGVDGISMPFVILTALLMPICILASWGIEQRVKEYMIAFLVLETMMIGVFCSLDLFLFYLFFEGGLIPMFLIIGIWGGARRVYASFKFFLYTLLGSVLMLLAMFAMYWHAGTSDIVVLLSDKEFPGISADMAVAGVLRLVRRQAADVAGAYLVARRARRGAHRRLRHSGGGAARRWAATVFCASRCRCFPRPRRCSRR